MEIKKLAKIIWDYHLLNNKLKKSDCILALGSNDIRVAQQGAKLFLDGFSDLLIFSGGVGKLTEGQYGCSEAEYFAKIAIEMGVPEKYILIEPKSTNTGENIIFTQELLKTKGKNPQSFIVVQKPFMQRRAYATFKKNWPEKDIIISSQETLFEDYPNKDMNLNHIINVMVGDLQRIKEYPALGFQIHQDIPDYVWDAYEKLVAMGYTSHLI